MQLFIKPKLRKVLKAEQRSRNDRAKQSKLRTTSTSANHEVNYRYRRDTAQEAELASMEAKDIEEGNLGLLASMTKVRACLLLARIQEQLGNRDKCIEFATLGVKLAGMAVGPKKALKGILRRCEIGKPEQQLD